MKDSSKSQAMKNLLMQSAKQKEQEVQGTASVAAKPEIETVEKPSATSEKTVEAEEKQPQGTEESTSNETAMSNVQKRKFADYLEDRKIKGNEVIRISSDTHKKLKRISTATGVSMYILASNILDIVCEDHNKEIQSLLKKYMSM